MSNNFSVRASRNCDLFTLDKNDLDTCLRFHKDLSTKIFQMASMQYHNLQNDVKASSTTINRRAMSVASASNKKSGTTVEDIELGMINSGGVGPNRDVETSTAQNPLLKYLVYFTFSHQSHFVKALAFVSILFNIVLSIIIPYEVCMNILQIMLWLMSLI